MCYTGEVPDAVLMPPWPDSAVAGGRRSGTLWLWTGVLSRGPAMAPDRGADDQGGYYDRQRDQQV